MARRLRVLLAMAPSATKGKRAAVVAAAAPKTKKARATAASSTDELAFARIRKEQGIPIGQLRSILAAIDHPLTEPMSEDCRAMLRHTVPLSICVPKDKRHHMQVEAVAITGEVIDGVAQKLHCIVSEEQSKIEEIVRKWDDLANSCAQASSALAPAQGDVDARKPDLAEKERSRQAAEKTLSEKQAEQRKGDQEVDGKTMERERIEACISDGFVAISAGTVDANDMKQCVDAVVFLAGELKLDDSLLEAMPSSLAKKPDARGPFDKMVLAQVEESFRNKIQELGVAIEALSPATQERAAAVSNAEETLQNAQVEYVKAEESMNAGRCAVQEAEVAKQAAEADVAAYEPIHKAATEVCDRKRVEMETFDSTKETFEQLCERCSKLVEAESEPLAVNMAEAGA